jgi:hypothetical protein
MEKSPVSFEVGGHRQGQPQRVVVEAAAHVGVALLGQRLVLVEARAVGELRGRQVAQALPSPVGRQVDHAEDVLVGVAVPEAAADARLVERGRPRQVQRGHALVRVPGVDHAADVRVVDRHLVGVEQARPVVFEPAQGRVDRGGVREPAGGLVVRLLIRHARPDELAALGILGVAEQKVKAAALAGREGKIDLERPDRRPAARQAARAPPGRDGRRTVEPFVHAHEGVARRVEAGHGHARSKVCKMVAALAVLGDVEDGAALDLDLAGREVALEVGRVVHRVPQAPLDEAEQADGPRTLRAVGRDHVPHLQRLAQRHEVRGGHLDAALGAADHAVAQAVAALVVVERGSRGFPRRVPDGPAILDVQVAAVGIQRHVVVPVAQQAAEAGIAVEAVPPCRVGDKAEEILAPQVVQPRQRGVGARDDVLAVAVVEVAVFHSSPIFILQRPLHSGSPDPPRAGAR